MVARCARCSATVRHRARPGVACMPRSCWAARIVGGPRWRRQLRVMAPATGRVAPLASMAGSCRRADGRWPALLLGGRSATCWPCAAPAALRASMPRPLLLMALLPRALSRRSVLLPTAGHVRRPAPVRAALYGDALGAGRCSWSASAHRCRRSCCSAASCSRRWRKLAAGLLRAPRSSRQCLWTALHAGYSLVGLVEVFAHRPLLFLAAVAHRQPARAHLLPCALQLAHRAGAAARAVAGLSLAL